MDSVSFSGRDMHLATRGAGHVRQNQQTGETTVKKSILALTLASSLSLSACATNPNLAQNAAIGRQRR
jgi:hypothetical protein